MNILIIGSGGRENSLAWKFSQSERVKNIYLWPGNPSSQFIAKTQALHKHELNFLKIKNFCDEKNIKFVFCGPEKPLEDGLVDYLTEHQIPIFGPNKAAARLETSKAFAKDIMTKHSIPTARYEVVSEFEHLKTKAEIFFDKYNGVVIKASALASGKGVFICTEKKQIEEAVITLEKHMQKAAEVCVLEEIMFGRETSYFLFLGKNKECEIGFAVDHKRLKVNNLGPNTGGMGAYTPVPWLPENSSELVKLKIVMPLLKALEEIGITYSGCLYVGLMWTDEGPKVVEYNVRLGDPETQALVFADDRDWVSIIEELLGLEKNCHISTRKQYFAKSIVLASPGYPYGGIKEDQVEVHENFFEAIDPDVKIFGASIQSIDNKIHLGTGRVLNIVARGDCFAACDIKIKQQISEIKKTWKEFQWRSDI